MATDRLEIDHEITAPDEDGVSVETFTTSDGWEHYVEWQDETRISHRMRLMPYAGAKSRPENETWRPGDLDPLGRASIEGDIWARHCAQKRAKRKRAHAKRQAARRYLISRDAGDLIPMILGRG